MQDTLVEGGALTTVPSLLPKIEHREQRNNSRNINKNVLPLKIAFLYLFASLKPHLQTEYKHSFEPPLF